MALWAALAAPAAAAQVRLEQPCRAPGQSVQVTASGLAPMTPFAVNLGTVPIGSGWTDETGEMDAEFPAPKTEGVHAVRVLDLLGNRGRAELTVRRPSIRLWPRPRRDPRRKVRFVVDGLGGGEPSVWLHRIDPRGRHVDDIRLGRASGPCGGLRSRRVALLPADPRPGRWRLQIDTRMSYDPAARPRVVQWIRLRPPGS